MNRTKSCGCDRPLGKTHVQWNGVGEISGDFWYNHIIRSANGSKGRTSIDLTIDKEYAWELFLKQNRKCALSGKILNFPQKSKDKNYTASLDRIDSSLGYIPSNMEFVTHSENSRRGAKNRWLKQLQ